MYSITVFKLLVEKIFQILCFSEKIHIGRTSEVFKIQEAQLYKIIALIVYAATMTLIGYINYGKSKTLDARNGTSANI